jgi:hypothetical protein
MVIFAYTQMQLFLILLFIFENNIDLNNTILILSERFSDNFINRATDLDIFKKVVVLNKISLNKNGFIKKVIYCFRYKKVFYKLLVNSVGMDTIQYLKNEQIFTGSPDSYILNIAASGKQLRGRLVLVEDGSVNYIDHKRWSDFGHLVFHFFAQINVKRRIKQASYYLLQRPEEANQEIKKNCIIKKIDVNYIFSKLRENEKIFLKKIFNIPNNPIKNVYLFWTTNISAYLSDKTDEVDRYYVNKIEEYIPKDKILFIKSHPAEPINFISLLNREVIIIDKEIPIELLECFDFTFELAVGPFSSIIKNLKNAKTIIQIPIDINGCQFRLKNKGFPENAFKEIKISCNLFDE